MKFNLKRLILGHVILMTFLHYRLMDLQLWSLVINCMYSEEILRETTLSGNLPINSGSTVQFYLENNTRFWIWACGTPKRRTNQDRRSKPYNSRSSRGNNPWCSDLEVPFNLKFTLVDAVGNQGIVVMITWSYKRRNSKNRRMKLKITEKANIQFENCNNKDNLTIDWCIKAWMIT